ncbi:C25 family cysteine peptidase [Mangrovivirga sp. M17]|uniref:C25 family cysteine peptidase n=1 Tax=Mangrovivirga halotolerans TaxID=2993936 RepID=A0ABT3RTR9_9BACT|nr:C25 family cysteine peptidase [Mangrovivirga halotolerans]MCX2744972.1 C25 family cysteine peptidase [Mangrovivirga halotolerans]
MNRSFKYLLFLVFVAFIFPVRAQYANDWINPNQNYYKIKVAETGFYNITYEDLRNIGVAIDEIDPRLLKLYFRGEEQSILIKGESDGSFDPDDELVFYGQRNDGSIDQQLYTEPGDQPHQFYNIFTDTAAYFLTSSFDGSLGKRMPTYTGNNTGDLPVIESHKAEALRVFTNQAATGVRYIGDIMLSAFDQGEQWTGTRVRRGQSFDFSLAPVASGVTTSSNPFFTIQLTGRNNRDHNVDIYVGSSPSELSLITTLSFNGFTNSSWSGEIPWSLVGPNDEVVVQITVNNTTTDDVSVSYASLHYTQNADMLGEPSKKFSFARQTTGDAIGIIRNASLVEELFDITDPDNIRKVSFENIQNDIQFIYDGALIERDFYATSNFLSVPEIQPVSFKQLDLNADYLIISNKLLRVPALDYDDPVEAYASYRASSEGGGYDTMVMNVQTIYDQFNYGQPGPGGIFNLVKFLHDNGNLKMIFIAGRALYWFRNYYRNGPITSDGGDVLYDLVPTSGFPGSDALYTAYLEGNNPYGTIPIGRYPAKDAQDVAVYLNKVREIEQLPFDALWRKDFLHLSGGLTENELISFRRYVNDFKVDAESHYMGGKVTTQGKSTNNSIEEINIAEAANNGLTMITFFGHSGTVASDIDIGKASDPTQGYENQGKYPFMLINGCSAGNLYSSAIAFSEDWLIIPNKGSIGFIAHANLAFSTDLRRYSGLIYDYAFSDSVYVNKSIGEVKAKIEKEYYNSIFPSERHLAQIHQMVLYSDPAVHLFGAKKPDYAAISETFSIEDALGGSLNDQSDSISINVAFHNFGTTVKDSINYRITRILEDGTTYFYDDFFRPSILYSDTIAFNIPNVSGAFGNNIFEITVDSENFVDELNEVNNTIRVPVFIPKSGVLTLLPPEFSVLSDTQTDLIVSSSDPAERNRTFVVDIDSSFFYSSPAFSSEQVSGEIIAERVYNLADQDSVSWYWRTKYASPTPEEDTSYVQSSFSYIEGHPEAWAQLNPGQFTFNDLEGIEIDPVTGQWNFENSEALLNLTTFGASNPDSDPENIRLFINDLNYIITDDQRKVCRNNSLNAVAFDRQNANPYAVLDNGNFDLLDPNRCGRRPQVINNFLNSQLNERNGPDLVDYINGLKNGDKVVIFSIGSASYSTLNEPTKQALSEIGVQISTWNDFSDGDPIIIVGEKGSAVGEAEVIKAEISPEELQEISFDGIITGRFDEGELISSRIGPATSFSTLKIKARSEANDNYSVDLIGENFIGDQNVIAGFTQLQNGEYDISTINPEDYPYLRLKYNISDTEDRTPAPMDYWFVTLSYPPEGILYPLSETQVERSELNEGESKIIDFGFRNISKKEFTDSLKVSLRMRNQETGKIFNDTIKINAPQPGEEEQFSVTFNTKGFAGENDLNVFVNPYVEPEIYYTNNVFSGDRLLSVKRDTLQPTLKVTFDGRTIMDGEIVSPDPLISIKVRDEQNSLRKTDTTGVELLFKPVCEGCNYEQVVLSSDKVEVLPALEDRDFTLNFRPGPLEDGVYSLWVKAADASGNQTGSEPYEISFEVINESTITNFYPYPNPFSTSTRFVFTLTGSDIPEEIKITIMTISGRIVREITQDELGPIHSGNNITEFSWDGTDEFGDKLANGVYLYKVSIRNQGEQIKQRSLGPDARAFKNGFGKLYILR